MRIFIKRDPQKITNNHLSDIDFKDYTKICKKGTENMFFFR